MRVGSRAAGRRSTCASSPRPTSISKTPSRRAASARICTIASRSSSSSCRRCASARRTSCRSRSTSCMATRSARNGNAVDRVRQRGRAALLDHTWLGNIRELENAIHHALLVCRDGRIAPDDLPLIKMASRRRPAATPSVLAVRTVDAPPDTRGGAARRADVALQGGRARALARARAHHRADRVRALAAEPAPHGAPARRDTQRGPVAAAAIWRPGRRGQDAGVRWRRPRGASGLTARCASRVRSSRAYQRSPSSCPPQAVFELGPEEHAVEVGARRQRAGDVVERHVRVRDAHARRCRIRRLPDDGVRDRQPEQLPLQVVEAPVNAEVEAAGAVLELRLAERGDVARRRDAGAIVGAGQATAASSA